MNERQTNAINNLKIIFENSPNAPHIYGKTNYLGTNARYIAVFAVSDSRIVDITKLACFATGLSLHQNHGIKLNGGGYSSIGHVAEALESTLGFTDGKRIGYTLLDGPY